MARPHAIKALSIFSHGSPYVPHLRGRHREPRSHVFYDSARRRSQAPATIRLPSPVPTLSDPLRPSPTLRHCRSISSQKRPRVNSLFITRRCPIFPSPPLSSFARLPDASRIHPLVFFIFPTVSRIVEDCPRGSERGGWLFKIAKGRRVNPISLMAGRFPCEIPRSISMAG